MVKSEPTPNISDGLEADDGANVSYPKRLRHRGKGKVLAHFTSGPVIEPVVVQRQAGRSEKLISVRNDAYFLNLKTGTLEIDPTHTLNAAILGKHHSTSILPKRISLMPFIVVCFDARVGEFAASQLAHRELAYFEGPGRHWDRALHAYAAARDAACWQLSRSETDLWMLLQAFEEVDGRRKSAERDPA